MTFIFSTKVQNTHKTLNFEISIYLNRNLTKRSLQRIHGAGLVDPPVIDPDMWMRLEDVCKVLECSEKLEREKTARYSTVLARLRYKTTKNWQFCNYFLRARRREI